MSDHGATFAERLREAKLFSVVMDFVVSVVFVVFVDIAATEASDSKKTANADANNEVQAEQMDEEPRRKQWWKTQRRRTRRSQNWTMNTTIKRRQLLSSGAS